MSNTPKPSSPPPVRPTGAGKGKKLLDQYSETLRNRHYSLRDVKTTMIYTHVLQLGPLAVKSPLDG
jgi:hypothetical protein